MINTIGRRKTAVARLYLDKAAKKPTFFVNQREVKHYFPHPTLVQNLYQPLDLISTPHPLYDIRVRVKGGGTRAQAEAIRLALARALVKLEEDKKPLMRTNGMLTRDARMVERKKYGRRKARRSFQFSKR